jgi:predicted DsbA family dithiol-disulfide isomerase
MTDPGPDASAPGAIAQPRPVRVDMVSDIACPWCWLGLRRLLGAIDASGVAVTVQLHPFQLDPSIPAQGRDWSDYARERFPDPARMAQARAMLESLGAAEGIDFAFASRRHASNTFDAHRLIRWAQGQSKGIAMKERLFRATFTEALDVGDRGVLSGLAGDVGLDRRLVADLLASDADVAATRHEMDTARRASVNGVPTFVIEGRWGVTGAQDVAILADALARVAGLVR